ncbi:MAG TPA: alpha/beta fold hydrolase [Beijerinckiaceae bacterium]
MSVAELLAELRSRDVQVSAEGDALRLNARPGALTPELRDRLRECKADVLEFLRSAKALAAQPRALVPLSRHGTGAPVFAVPGHNGDVFCWRAMAQHLDHPFFGLQPPGLDGEAKPLTSVEDLAGYFAGQIRALVPDGPVIVAGYCAGGAIAFELARRLQAAGTKVRFVALFGSPHPAFFRSLRRPGHAIVSHWKKLASLSVTACAAYIVERLRQRRLRSEDPVLTLRVAVERATIMAVRGYTPTFFPGRLCLFLPENGWARTRFGASLWRSVAGLCDEYPGPAGCDADDMLIEPNARVLSEVFRGCSFAA